MRQRSNILFFIRTSNFAVEAEAKVDVLFCYFEPETF